MEADKIDEKSSPKRTSLLNIISFAIIYALVLFFLSCALIYGIRSWKVSQYKLEEQQQLEAINGHSAIIKFKSRQIFTAFEQEKYKDLEALLKDKIFPRDAMQEAIYDYSWPERPHLAEKCVTRGLLKPLNVLLESGLKVDVNELNLFNLAIRNLSKNRDQIKILELIHKHGADLSLIDPNLKVPPLFLAISYKNIVALQFILDQKVNPNQIHPRHDSALHYAVKSYYKAQSQVHTDMIKLLLKSGANPFILSTKSGLSPFHLAIKKYPDCIDLIESFFTASIPNCDLSKYRLSLINHRTGITKNPRGYTPLHLAVEIGSLELSKALINFGADLALKNSNGLSPPELASRLRSRKLKIIFNDQNNIK